MRILRHVQSAAGQELYVRRDSGDSALVLRPLARRLARREAAALVAAEGVSGVPRLVAFDGTAVLRTFIDGVPMHEARPCSPAYFKDALRLLVALHRRGIAHNDLAKEANWLCTPDGRAALVDFQVAVLRPRRGPLFRALAREDLRHLLKHKRTYLPQRLTARQRALLAHPGPLARAWARIVKPPYRFVTRSVLGWPERTGPEERRDPL
ncbi:MAG TPA: serine/threonine protein kinase [Gammaproteobacteria bacterium]